MDQRVKELRSELSMYSDLKQQYQSVVTGSGYMLTQESRRHYDAPAALTYRRVKTRELQFLEEGVKHLEHRISTMESIVGTEATKIMMRVYSDREGVENVGYALGYSRRLLETKLKNWMTAVVDNVTYSSECSLCEVDVTTQARANWQMASCRKKQPGNEVENEKN